MGVSRQLSNRFKEWGTEKYSEVIFQIALVAFIAVGVIVPMAFVLLQSVHETPLTSGISLGSISLAHFTSVFSTSVFWSAVKNTLIFSLGSVIIAHLIGFVLAYVLTRMEIPYRGVFHTMIFLPIFLSPLVMSLGYSYGFTEGGYYYRFLSLFMKPFSISNVWGMVFVSSIWLTPFTYSFISAGLKNIDPDMEDAARIIGAGEGSILAQISVPLLKPFLMSSFFLTLLLTFQEISIPIILGLPERTYVLATYIVALQNYMVPPPYGMMAAIGVAMVLISLLIVTLIQRLIGDVSEYTVITGQGQTRSIDTSPGKQVLAVGGLSVYLFVFVILPLLQVISLGFTKGSGVTIIPFADFTTKWFSQLLHLDTLKKAIKNTLIIALTTASASVVLTGVVAYITNRVDGVASAVLEKLAWIPIATPGVVLGLGYLWTVLYAESGLYGTIYVLMIAFFIRFLALGMRMNSSLISQQAVEMDEQAKICGSGLFSRLRHIIFPNAKNGMLSVWVILFTLFMNELSTSFFLYTSSSRVITVTLFELWFTAQTSVLGALATLQIVIILTVVVAMMKLFDVEIEAV